MRLTAGLILTVVLWGALARPAGAEIIVDRLDPDGTDAGYLFPQAVQWDGWSGNPVDDTYRRSAVRFEVPAGDFSLTAVHLPIYIAVNTDPPRHLIRVRLTTDDAGQPDSTLEVLSSGEDIWPTDGYQPATLITSSLQPLLRAGETYWIVVEPLAPGPGPAGGYHAYWQTTLCRASSWTRHQDGSLDPPADPWPDPAGLEKLAFRVEGTPMSQVVGYPDHVWPHYPNQNVPVHTGVYGDQIDPVAVADGQGGAFVAWADSRGGPLDRDIYLQRLDDAGLPLLVCGGVPVCTAANDQIVPFMAPDSEGGVILAWQDKRVDTGNIYAQAMNPDGTPRWAADGVLVCNAANIQAHPVVVPDVSGGAIIVWSDARSGSFDIYAQRVSAAGTVQWAANGVPICSLAGDQIAPEAVSDGAAGAIITWRDFRSFIDYDVYAQRVNSAGTTQWTANGVAVASTLNNQTEPRLVADGAGGAVVVWLDARNDINNFDLYAQRLNANGAGTWAANGIPVCTAGGNQIDHRVSPDGSGGALVAWEDPRSGSFEVYTQRITPGGARLWPVDGVNLSSAAGDQRDPVIVADELGGAWVAWKDEVGVGGGDIRSAHVYPDGAFFPQTLSSASQIQRKPVLVTDGARGAIAAFEDTRNGGVDVYAQRVEFNGYLGNPEAAILTARDVPGDEGGLLHLTWRGSYLETTNPLTVDEYRIWRAVPPNAPGFQATLGSSEATTLDPEIALATGRTLVTRSFGQTYAWENVGTLEAVLAPTYGADVPTVVSGPGGPESETVFMIQARSNTGEPSLLSRPVSVLAIDNLAPSPPVGLAAQYTPGWIDLHWSPNPEPDLWIYRVYRGLDLDFVPGPGNLFAEGSDTTYAGPTDASYIYKISAVDIHGNESGWTTVTAWHTGIPGEGGTIFALRAPAPNPARDRAELAWSLPRAGDVSLELFDVRGRRVATVLDGPAPAGETRETIPLLDDSGRTLASGMYFLRLVWDGRSETRRLVVVR